MANHLSALLQKWLPEKDQLDWVLATVIETQGSSYRKSGAMMFINSLGQYYGLISGGCLESDVMRQARKCWDRNTNQIVTYDMQDEDDLAWKLGIGCGGMVKLLLQPISKENNYLNLRELHEAMTNSIHCFYQQSLDLPSNEVLIETPQTLGLLTQQSLFISKQLPVVKMAVFGGGVDAQPLVGIAKQMGWHVSLFDERLGYAKESAFPDVDVIHRESVDSLSASETLNNVTAAILLNHNVRLDAKALKYVMSSDTKFIGILGPMHRTQRVLDEANIKPQDIEQHVANPVGLDLGGELPESIALSIMAQIHAYVHDRDGSSLSEFEQNKICLKAIG